MRMNLSRRIVRLLRAGMRVERIAVALHASVATVYRWRACPPKRPMRALLDRLDEIEKTLRVGEKRGRRLT